MLLIRGSFARAQNRPLGCRDLQKRTARQTQLLTVAPDTIPSGSIRTPIIVGAAQYYGTIAWHSREDQPEESYARLKFSLDSCNIS